MSETKTAKVDRLIADGRVLAQLTLPDGGTVWRVTGDVGKSYRVVVNGDGTEWSCDCAYRYPDCSHAWAVLRIMDKEPPAIAADELAADEGDGPREVLDVHLPIEVIDTDTADEVSEPVVEIVDNPDDEDEAGTNDGQTTANLLQRPPVVQPAINEAPVTWQTIHAIQHTEIVPAAMRGKPATILAAMLQGRDRGLGPFESLRMVNVIEGRVAPSAEMLLRMYHRAGHRLTVRQADDRAVELAGTRGDTGDELVVRFTVADAERAGLLTVDATTGEIKARSARGNKMPWETYTPDLLWARAVSRLVSRLAPDAADHTWQ